MRNDLQARIAALLPPIRQHLLAGVLAFTQAACQLPGVTRIALIGSLTTDKPDPKDADVLVTVADDADLTLLAAHGRKLLGHAQSRNRGGEPECEVAMPVTYTDRKEELAIASDVREEHSR